MSLFRNKSLLFSSMKQNVSGFNMRNVERPSLPRLRSIRNEHNTRTSWHDDDMMTSCHSRCGGGGGGGGGCVETCHGWRSRFLERC